MGTKAVAGLAAIGLAGLIWSSFSITPEVQAGEPRAVSGKVTQGALLIRDSDGAPKLECPLKHTDVRADISGFLARVTVTQEFENTARDKVEAVYVFPLPHTAAVDSMTLHVGERTVKGDIRRRDEARAIYEAARNQGRVAALLDQERPNIFVQNVANILPGEKVRITISYVERLQYEAGTYEFVFPMVVGPRYMPERRQPDAASISPPVTRPDTRAGHDVSVEVKLDAGVAVEAVDSRSHDVVTERPSASRAVVRLREKRTIPNKDFVLRYEVAGRSIQDAVLTHRGDRGGFFTLILQPPERVTVEDVTPKEIVFVLDTSGSMSGFPIEKAKEAMRLAIDGLNPQDTFNLITFAGDTHVLFEQPVAATRDNLQRAQRFLSARSGSGGTEMMKAIRAALVPSDSNRHVRVVCFMTDGYVGNESEILSEIRRNPNARIFSFGIGSSVNRYLLDKMAEAGRGEVEYVSLNDNGSAAARRFHERVRSPLLTDIDLEWNGLPVTDVLPARVPDLFGANPIVVAGRYAEPGKGTLRLRGKLAGAPITRDIAVELPASAPQNDVLATLSARMKVDSLMHADGTGEQQITQLGLDYKLLTPYTSFVAVEETTITEGGQPRRVEVPVELPEGVSYDGIFGHEAHEVAWQPATMRFRATGAAVMSAHAPAVLTRPVPKVRGLDTSRAKIDPALSGATGVLRVQVWLTDTSEAMLDQLRKLGFEVLGQPKTARLVIGRIGAEKLEALGRLPGVVWIGPLKQKR